MLSKFLKSLTLLLVVAFSLHAQNVSVSPSRFYYKVNPGGMKAQTLKVSNNSKTKESFSISFGDFSAPGSAGKSVMLAAGESPNSLSKYISASPAFFELEPGASQDVQVVVDMPNTPDANKVKWGALKLKLEKNESKTNNGSKNGVGMGILETFQFVVHVFQTPPNITFKQAEIMSLKEIAGAGDDSTGKTISMTAKNTGDAILDCAGYIELVNLRTGKKERMKPSAFTILPGGSREVKFVLPSTLEKGKYNLTGVVDFGSKDEVQAAEMELTIN